MRGQAAAALLALWTTAAAADPSTSEAYARAAKLLDGNLATAILNATVTPHWIGGGSSFWYRRDTAAGPDYWIVESATGRRRPAFDVAKLRAAAGDKLPAALPISEIDASEAVLSTPGGTLRCDILRYRCATEKKTAASPDTSWAPDKSVGVFARDNNLWLKRAGDALPVQLTRDGVEHDAYGVLPGTSLFAVPLARAALASAPLPPMGVAWSPDNRHVVATRSDERAVKPYPIVEWVPQDGSFTPKDWAPRIPVMGDAERSIQQTTLFDVASGRATIAALPDGWAFMVPSFAWSADGARAYGIAETRWAKHYGLTETDVATGKVRLLIDEAALHHGRTNSFVYNPANVRILERSHEVLWFSERDGWGQIYLYDLATGKLKRKVTSGPRTVRDLIAVDERRRILFFTADGTDQSVDPYNIKLYAISLDGGRERLLTPEEAVHVVSRAPIGNGVGGSVATAALSPDGNWLVESYSSLDQPPVNMLRSAADGRIVSLFERADVSKVEAAGWRKPTRIKVTAADGKTPIWGTLYFPPDMQPGVKYPVIDATYGGPQITNAPGDYVNAVATMNPRSRASLAALGFIVVTIDGRGTPGRSEAFNAASYEDFADPELADHVAGIKQLGARYGSFDLSRVGVYGHSFGGYVSARAMLTHPDFYKVAVSSAGIHSFQSFYPVEGLFPVPDYGRGRISAPEPNAVPANYRKLDNMHLADNLKGKLLLCYGDLDENALPASTLQLVDALIKANKPYDLLYLPNRTHEFFRTDAYYTQRMWDYFVRNLQGKEPPADFTLTLPPAPSAFGY
jgi:dipeptidyl-peptidase-4